MSFSLLLRFTGVQLCALRIYTDAPTLANPGNGSLDESDDSFLLQRRGSRLRSCLQCQIISDRHVGHWRDALRFALFPSLSRSLFLSVTGVRLARACGASSAADWSCAQSIQRSGITRLGPRAKGESLKRLIHLLCPGRASTTLLL